MKLHNPHIRQAILLFAAFLSLCAMVLGVVISSNTQLAMAVSETYSLKIHIDKYEEILAHYSGPTADHSALKLEMWSLNRHQLINNDLQTTLETLHNESEAQLRTRFTSSYIPIMLENQYLYAQGITEGIYYVRGNLPVNGKDNKFEFILDTSTAGSVREFDITAKTIGQRETPVGSYYFLKVSDDARRKPLRGAVFEVYRKTDAGEYVPYKRDGRLLTVQSGDDGEFSVTNVPYGHYALKEVQAPRGYALAENMVLFTVDANHDETLHVHKQHDVIVITNHRVPPLARTGASIIIVAVCVICAIILGICVRNGKLKRDE
ncbi:hypothetical protein EJ419_06905 [Alloscardovia theropitheci]|uniref:SpaA-like prealbumin fold domain-containing protein n=1 Tax=Alloscardovia theropitheci TaxID=2496842 RepID=A0A4R0QRL9_9BIFI|nr:SpaA isopeptide-forming pilin-related protein [Alloscardovia theropitheci]TCD53695.1 hypothetical protein EJ419_06905 [Alloscardovia theropitheci]